MNMKSMLLLCVALLVSPMAIQAETYRVSISSEGKEANADSHAPELSQDGRFVVFSSEANNLVDEDTNGKKDVFVHDRMLGKTKRVSIASDGTEANGDSGFRHQHISGDGRYVVFDSVADNLVPNDNNETWDAFTHDIQTGVTRRVSVASDGLEANYGGGQTNISTDGRFVTFESSADNLVPGDTNHVNDIFVHDLETGLTSRVNVASDGTEANAGNYYGYWGFDWYTHPISTDGRYVAFSSPADNLVPGDENGGEDVFVHDRETGETQIVSVSSTGLKGNQSSFLNDMSADGRFVLFYSNSTNLSTDGEWGLFLHDRDTGETTKIPGGGGFSATISDDGRFVAFTTTAGNLLPWDSDYHWDIYVFDRLTQRISLVSRAHDGGETNGASAWISISGDGSHLAFSSSGDNLIPNDSNDASDIFLTGNAHMLPINPGLSDAWYDPATGGQGFYIAVHLDLGKVSLAWFTYDTERPPADATANLGNPGHRWLTALGRIDGNQAVMQITHTSGGIFDSTTEVTRVKDGTIILTFDSCNSGFVEYDIPSINRQGWIPIRRVANDSTLTLVCEAFKRN